MAESDLASVEALRLYLAEKILKPEDEDPDVHLSDPELEMLLTTCRGVFYRAVADGWAVMAGRLHYLVDLNENGSDRKLSQRYKNAKAQADWFNKVAEEESKNRPTTRVAPVAASVWATEDERLISIFSDNYGYIRQYPLFRFPAVLS